MRQGKARQGKIHGRILQDKSRRGKMDKSRRGKMDKTGRGKMDKTGRGKMDTAGQDMAGHNTAGHLAMTGP